MSGKKDKKLSALSVVTESTQTFSSLLETIDCCICLCPLLEEPAAEEEDHKDTTADPLQQQQSAALYLSLSSSSPLSPASSSSSSLYTGFLSPNTTGASFSSSSPQSSSAPVCTLPCGHLFHVSCLSGHLEARKDYSRPAECPLCRAVIPKWTPEDKIIREALRQRYVGTTAAVGRLGGGSSLQDFIPDPPAEDFIAEARSTLEALARRNATTGRGRGRGGRGGRSQQAAAPPVAFDQSVLMTMARSIAASRGEASRREAKERAEAAEKHEGVYKMYTLNLNRRKLVIKDAGPTCSAEGRENGRHWASGGQAIPTAIAQSTSASSSGVGYQSAATTTAASSTAAATKATDEQNKSQLLEQRGNHVQRTLLQFKATGGASSSAATANRKETKGDDVVILTQEEAEEQREHAKQLLHARHHNALIYLEKIAKMAKTRHEAEKNLASRVLDLGNSLKNMEEVTMQLLKDSRIAQGLAAMDKGQFEIEYVRLEDGSFLQAREVETVFYTKAAFLLDKRDALQKDYEKALLEQERLDAELQETEAEIEAIRRKREDDATDDEDQGERDNCRYNEKEKEGGKYHLDRGPLSTSSVSVAARASAAYRVARMTAAAAYTSAIGGLGSVLGRKRSRSPLSVFLEASGMWSSLKTSDGGGGVGGQGKRRVTRGDVLCSNGEERNSNVEDAVAWSSSLGCPNDNNKKVENKGTAATAQQFEIQPQRRSHNGRASGTPKGINQRINQRHACPFTLVDLENEEVSSSSVNSCGDIVAIEVEPPERRLGLLVGAEKDSAIDLSMSTTEDAEIHIWRGRGSSGKANANCASRGDISTCTEEASASGAPNNTRGGIKEDDGDCPELEQRNAFRNSSRIVSTQAHDASFPFFSSPVADLELCRSMEVSGNAARLFPLLTRPRDEDSNKIDENDSTTSPPFSASLDRFSVSPPATHGHMTSLSPSDPLFPPTVARLRVSAAANDSNLHAMGNTNTTPLASTNSNLGTRVGPEDETDDEDEDVGDAHLEPTTQPSL